MDETAYKAKIAELEGQVASLTGQVTTLTQTVKEKDVLIAQKNNDIIGARKKYKKLGEMTDEEKANLTPEQIAEKEAMDEIVTNQEKLAEETAAQQAKEVLERRTQIARKMVGDNQEAIDKVLKNFDLIKGADLATTESEIAPFMTTALNMLGSDRPDPVRSAINGGGGDAPSMNPGQFAESQQGVELATMMGLPTEAPKTN